MMEKNLEDGEEDDDNGNEDDDDVEDKNRYIFDVAGAVGWLQKNDGKRNLISESNFVLFSFFFSHFFQRFCFL